MDFFVQEDTICAIATPPGEGGIGIVRMSGPRALPISMELFHPSSSSFRDAPRSHRLYHGWIRDPSEGRTVDEVLLSYMAAPRSYTCEDVVEINCHSGYAVLERILELVMDAGARLAQPGEFTRRAFLNGRLDLSQAEAVGEVIHSRSRQSLYAAGRSLAGDLRQQVEAWRSRLLELQVELEAHIDFTDEMEETEKDSGVFQLRLRESLMEPVRKLLKGFRDGRVLKEGLSLVLVGKPNVGKSSLLNLLLGKDRAIVTPTPGTTRDVIEESFLLSGVLVRVLDTAGIRREPDEIERMGIEKALRCVEDADVALWLIDQSRPLNGEDDLIHERLRDLDRLMLLNKADLPPALTVDEVRSRYGEGHPVLPMSVFDPSDLDRLREILTDKFLRKPLETCRSALIPNLRQKGCLERALEALHRAEALLEGNDYPEIVALELGAARREMDSILGWNMEEDLLDHIFSRFCIGK